MEPPEGFTHVLLAESKSWRGGAAQSVLAVVFPTNPCHHISGDERELAGRPTDAVHKTLRPIINGPPLPPLKTRKAPHCSPRTRAMQPEVITR